MASGGVPTAAFSWGLGFRTFVSRSFHLLRLFRNGDLTVADRTAISYQQAPAFRAES